jgi:CDP-glycerol glycerophosphotransferase (TagB/SpsB family)
LEAKFGGEWVVLLRLHPNLVSQSKSIKKINGVIDVSAYEEGEELVAASDLMITDYSSIMFEPAFVKKPVFLFAPDRKEYIDGERELLIDYDTLPFPIAESNEELMKNIQQFDKDIYERQIEQFLEAYGVHEDGHASERAAQFILNLMKKD